MSFRRTSKCDLRLLHHVRAFLESALYFVTIESGERVFQMYPLGL